MQNILVSGSLAYDRIMDFPGLFKNHFLPEKLHALSVSFTIENLAEGFGGTAGNIAYNLSLLGLPSSVYSAAGNDFGRYRAWLTERGVDTTHVVVSEKPTAAAYVMTDKDDSQITAFYFGAGERPCTMNIPHDTPLAIVGAGNIADMLSVPAQCRAIGIPFFADTGQQITSLSAEQLREHMEGAAIFFGNDYEVDLVIKKSGWDMDELLAHVGVAIVTKGAQGSTIHTKNGEETVMAVPAKAVDPTGAGDAYRAGFAAGYLAKRSLRECAMLGSVLGAYAVESYGTQNHMFTMDELKKRYEEAYGETFPL